jgi:hypothetical protein
MVVVLLLGKKAPYFTLPDGRTVSSQRGHSFIDTKVRSATSGVRRAGTRDTNIAPDGARGDKFATNHGFTNGCPSDWAGDVRRAPDGVPKIGGQ